MEEGFITLHRKIKKWEWYTDLPTFKLFIHLLLSANHEDRKWRGQLIKRGQLLTSLNHLSTDTGLSRQQVRTALEKLKATHEITQTSTHKSTLITIEKYSDYQDKKEKVTQLSTHEATNKQHSSNTVATLNNNYNNINNINNKNNIKKVSKETKQSFNTLIENYSENETLREELKNHLATRKLKKGALTNRAIELELNKLDDLVKNYPINDQENKKIEIVRKSIENGWISFYPLKENNTTKKSSILDFL